VRRLRTPSTATAREQLRVRLYWGMAALYALFAVGVFYFVRAGMGPYPLATQAAAYVTLSAAAGWVLTGYGIAGPYRSSPGWNLALGVLVGSSFGVLVFGYDQGSWHLPTPLAVAVTAGGALAAGVGGVLWARRESRSTLDAGIRRLADQRAAQPMYEATAHLGTARGGSAEEQKAITLNLARAGIRRSSGDDSPDGLVEGMETLRHLLVSDPPDDWLDLLAGAADLVDAASVKALKQGDLSGYTDALDLMAEVARRVPPDAGPMAFVHAKWAEYHAIRWDRLPPGAEAAEQAAAAEAALRAAIAAVTPPISGMLPGWHADLGFLLAQRQAGSCGLEAGIAECRTAVRLARRSPRARAQAWRSLAALLTDQAMELAGGPPEEDPDAELAVKSAVQAALAEAERIARLARWYGGFDGRVDAWQRLAEVRTARAVIFGSLHQARRAARTWRLTSRAAVHSDPTEQVRLGQLWASLAEVTQNPALCAEAYEYLMSKVPRAVGVRYLAGERDRILADLQSTAEQAGYWLAQAGRLGDAAVALELGRAVSLSEILGREQPGLDVLLAQVGRPDLLDRYRQTLKEYSEPTTSSPDNDDDALAAAAQRAWSRYDAVAREIAAVTGVNPLSARITLADLAGAATEGPVVYLAAADHGGYAIIVSAEGPPAYVPLHQLNRADAAELVESFPRGPGFGPEDVDEIAEAARRLWTAGIGTLAADLPAGALVTLIPVGLLSLLPLHAAGGPAAPSQGTGEWEFLADRVTVRYAPNARTLLGTRQRADALAQVPLTLLTVAAPYVDQGSPIPNTVREVTEIARRWTQAKLITDGSPAAVAELSGDHTVWHLACHCRTVPERILDSALQLRGAEVTLRAVLAMRSVPRRLAVLSACNTHVSGAELPDEAIGLPTGLLHAGFAGVVASHWPTSDSSTPYLMIRFHELWHGQGLPPATALAEAQRWLRWATDADLRACLGGVAEQPVERSPARLAQWEAARSHEHHSDEHGPRRPYSHPFHWAPFALTGH
jgi:CHAT domain-containing protein